MKRPFETLETAFQVTCQVRFQAFGWLVVLCARGGYSERKSDLELVYLNSRNIIRLLLELYCKIPMFFFALIVKSPWFFGFKKNIPPPNCSVFFRYLPKALRCFFFCRVGFPYIYPHCLGAVSILPKRVQLSVHTFDRYCGPHEVGDYLPMCLSQSASTSSNLMIGSLLPPYLPTLHTSQKATLVLNCFFPKQLFLETTANFHQTIYQLKQKKPTNTRFGRTFPWVSYPR